MQTVIQSSNGSKQALRIVLKKKAGDGVALQPRTEPVSAQYSKQLSKVPSNQQLSQENITKPNTRSVSKKSSAS